MSIPSVAVAVAAPESELEAARAEIEGLRDALATRKVIGQAIGILMERHDMDEGEAFAYLTRVSSHTNVKLRMVAAEIVAQRNDQSRTVGTQYLASLSQRPHARDGAAPAAAS
jgi:AmiR/NasT family two-component response regulator